jgi:hypothetical protein
MRDTPTFEDANEAWTENAGNPHAAGRVEANAVGIMSRWKLGEAPPVRQIPVCAYIVS